MEYAKKINTIINKYTIGQDVFVLIRNKIEKLQIFSIDILIKPQHGNIDLKTQVLLNFSLCDKDRHPSPKILSETFNHSELFETKQELLNSL